MTLRTTALVTAIVGSVAVASSLVQISRFVYMSRGAGWNLLFDTFRWSVNIIADAMVVAFLFALFAHREGRR